MKTAALTAASTSNILSNIYSAEACCDTSDVLGNVQTLWERVGSSLSGLLEHSAAYRRMKTLARKYNALKPKESAADANFLAKYYEVAQFEKLFSQILAS